MATDHREISDNGFDQLEQMLPTEDFGRIVYVLAFNEKGRDMVFTRKCRRANDIGGDNIEDDVWRITNEALALKRNQDAVAGGGPEIEFSHILLGKTEDQDTITVRVMRSACDDDIRCPRREFCIPKQL